MMKEKIQACFDRLQGLEIRPTVSNMETLLQTLYDLREVWQELNEKETDNNGGTTADSE